MQESLADQFCFDNIVEELETDSQDTGYYDIVGKGKK